MQQYLISGAEEFNYQNGTLESRCVAQVQYRTPNGKIHTIHISDVPGLQTEYRKYTSHNNGDGMILKPHEFVPINNDMFTITEFLVLTDDGIMILGRDALLHWDIQFFIIKDFAIQAGWLKPQQSNNEPDDTPLQTTREAEKIAPNAAPKPLSEPAQREMTPEQMTERFNEIFAIAPDERTEEETAEMKRLAPIVNDYMRSKIMGSVAQRSNTPQPRRYTEELYQICLSYDRKQIDWKTFKKQIRDFERMLGSKSFESLAKFMLKMHQNEGLSVTLKDIERCFKWYVF